jgi:hypothetical protein
MSGSGELKREFIGLNWTGIEGFGVEREVQRLEWSGVEREGKMLRWNELERNEMKWNREGGHK